MRRAGVTVVSILFALVVVVSGQDYYRAGGGASAVNASGVSTIPVQVPSLGVGVVPGATGTVTATSTIQGANYSFVAVGGQIYWPAQSVLQNAGNGISQFTNYTGTGFTRLILGTNDATTNGASWNLNAGVLEAKTGDGSAYAGLRLGALGVGVAAGAAGTVTLAGLVVGTNPATVGEIRAATGFTLQARNAANTANLRVLSQTAADKVHIDMDGGGIILGNASDIQWNKALVALGGGAVPTLGTIGGAGPATAAQNTWMRVIDSAGVAFWVPAWK